MRLDKKQDGMVLKLAKKGLTFRQIATLMKRDVSTIYNRYKRLVGGV